MGVNPRKGVLILRALYRCIELRFAHALPQKAQQMAPREAARKYHPLGGSARLKIFVLSFNSFILFSLEGAKDAPTTVGIEYARRRKLGRR